VVPGGDEAASLPPLVAPHRLGGRGSFLYRPWSCSALGVQASLPEPAADGTVRGFVEDIEEMDLLTEIRSVIGCVLNDCMAPAIGDLRAAAAFPASEAEGGRG
jgi:hypothetical protein